MKQADSSSLFFDVCTSNSAPIHQRHPQVSPAAARLIAATSEPKSSTPVVILPDQRCIAGWRALSEASR